MKSKGAAISAAPIIYVTNLPKNYRLLGVHTSGCF